MPVVWWIGFVHWLSTRPGPSVRWIEIPVIDKFGHFVMYAIFGFLMARALRWPSRKRAILVVLGCAAAHGGLVEWMQGGILGRSGEFLDFVADVVGAASGAWLSGREKSQSAQALT